VFDWHEMNGPRVEPPGRRGFGMELLESTLGFELKAETALSFDASGLRCTVRVPLLPRLFALVERDPAALLDHSGEQQRLNGRAEPPALPPPSRGEDGVRPPE
jgi:hypothetical protein